jgi:hypothetical protein
MAKKIFKPGTFGADTFRPGTLGGIGTVLTGLPTSTHLRRPYATDLAFMRRAIPGADDRLPRVMATESVLRRPAE